MTRLITPPSIRQRYNSHPSNLFFYTSSIPYAFLLFPTCTTVPKSVLLVRFFTRIFTFNCNDVSHAKVFDKIQNLNELNTEMSPTVKSGDRVATQHTRSSLMCPTDVIPISRKFSLVSFSRRLPLMQCSTKNSANCSRSRLCRPESKQR